VDLLREFSQLVRFLNEQSLHLVTIVSRALQPQDGRIQCPVDRNLEFFLTSYIDFFSCLDNVEVIVNKICFCKAK